MPATADKPPASAVLSAAGDFASPDSGDGTWQPLGEDEFSMHMPCLLRGSSDESSASFDVPGKPPVGPQ